MTATVPFDVINALRLAMFADATVKAAAEVSVTGNAIFGHEYPAKTAQQTIDYAAQLTARSRRLIVLQPAGRRRLQDQGNAPIGAPRVDVWNYGRTKSDAMALHWVTHAFLRDLADALVTMSAGSAVIRSVTVEAGPFAFTDQDTNTPVVVGTYAALAAETYRAA